MKLHWFYFNERFYFESMCGHDISYDPVKHMVVDDWLSFDGGAFEDKIPVSEIPPLFRPAFEQLTFLLTSILP